MTSHLYSEHDVKKAFDLIQQAHSITLLTHQNPDADGVSACAALAHIFISQGKTVQAIYPSECKPELKRQPPNVLVQQHTHIPDLIITLDTANYERLYYPEAFRGIPLINIDHHISNRINGTINLNNPKASSTCEELVIILQQWNPSFINRYVAECLLFGILFDSQVFRTQSTTSRTLRIAADLVDFGINMFELKLELMAHMNPAIVALWGKELSGIKTSTSGNAAWVVVTQADLKQAQLTSAVADGLSNLLAEISGVDVSIVFYEIETGQTKASLRSKKTDVNALARNFGGGGHKNAAGIMTDMPIMQFVQAVTEEL